MVEQGAKAYDLIIIINADKGCLGYFEHTAHFGLPYHSI